MASSRSLEGPALYQTLSLGEREALRTTKLLNAKERVIGVDVAALDDGVRARQSAEERSRALDAAAAALADTHRKVADAVHDEVQRRRVLAATATASVWDVQRDKTLRREWDLSDPARVAAATLPRDTGPLYETRDMGHASAAQVFAGELLEDPAIPAAKRSALVSGLARGEAETAAARQAAAEVERLSAATAETSRRAADIHDATIRSVRHASLSATVAVNHSLHQSRVESESKYAEWHARAARLHVHREEANPFLREDTRTAVSAADPRRFRPDHFKGFSAAQVAGVYSELDAVADAARRLREEERKTQEAAEDLLLTQKHVADGVAAATEAERAVRLRAYYTDLAAAAAAKKNRDARAREEERARQYPTATGILAGFGKSLK